MATLDENLIILNETKQAIKQAIEDKGTDLTGVPFTEYSNKIADIRTSEDLNDALIDQEEAITNLEAAIGGGEVVEDYYEENVDYASQIDILEYALNGKPISERDYTEKEMLEVNAMLKDMLEGESV